MEATALVVIVCCVVLVSYWFVQSKGGRTPPGPLGLPFVGYLPFMTDSPHQKLQELQKVYGPVFSLRLGSEYVVILGDFASIKNAFSQDAFMGRPTVGPFHLNKESIDSEAFSGMPWKEQRRVSLHLLRDVGFGKLRTEELIKDEIEDLVARLEATAGRPTTVTSQLTPSTSNNIATLMFGRRLDPGDPRRVELDEMLNEFGASAGQLSWQVFFPWVKSLMRFLHVGVEERLARSIGKIKDYVWQEIQDHEMTLDPNNTRDYIDGYLLEIARRKNDPAFKTAVLQDLVAAFFGAGSETVRIAVEWLLLLMASEPKVQHKVQSEIDRFVGRGRSPSRADQAAMTYTTAAILEGMRWRTIAAINPTRLTLSDTELNGYFIPKNSIVVANLWSVDHDPDLWGNDFNVYNPERFLAQDGISIRKIEHFIPFSIGKRSCPGESFAKTEIFLYFTSILQKFNLSFPPDGKPDFDGILGMALTPKVQEIHFHKRQ